MKNIYSLIILIILCPFLLLGQNVLKTTVTNLSFENSPLDQVIETLEHRYNIQFAYNPDAIQLDQLISQKFDEVPLSSVLDYIFDTVDLSVTLRGEQIIIKPKAKSPHKVIKETNKVEAITVSGTVLSKEDELPLIGVNIKIKNTSQGTLTDFDGKFSLTSNLPEITLIFSYIGKIPQERTFKSSEVVEIRMEDNAVQLKGLVVTGYGTTAKKEDLIGSADHVTTEQLEMKPVGRVDALLDGIVPGLQFEVQSDDASSARPRYQTRIRGEASFSASNEPLWIVDGVPIYTGNKTNLIPGLQTSISPLSYLNPKDIESMTVLKDAAATSIYGANGANGVILITTKKGSYNKETIQFSTRHGLNRPSDNHFQVLDADQYRELALEAYINSGRDLADYPFGNENDDANTDWYDLYFQNGLNSQYDLSFSGGNDRTNYYVSGGYYRSEGTIIQNLTNRYSARINLNQKLGERVKVDFRFGMSFNDNNLFTPNYDYFETRPNIDPYNADGTFALYDDVTGLKYFNKLAEAYQNDDHQTTFATTGNIALTYNIMEGLTFTSQNGIDNLGSTEDQYDSRNNWSGRDLSGTPVGYAYRAQNNILKWISINRLNFVREWGRNRWDILVGTEATDQIRRSVSGSGSNFANDYIREISYSPSETQRASSSREEESAFSYFGRVVYNYDSRYGVSVSYRRDGNSRFGDDVRYANFFSTGASWKIHNEEFWKSDYIDFLSLKTSIGTNGNSRIGLYDFKGLYSFSDGYAYNQQPGTIITTGANPDFSWETTLMFNTGIEIGLWDKIDLSLEYYSNTTRDLIDNVDVSRTTGDTRILRNIGRVRNSGVEATINTINIETEDFKWTTSFNIAHNANKILELYNNNDKVLDKTIRRVGEDSRTLYLIRWAGVDPRDGAPLWYDAGGNITREFSTDNRVAVGTTNPTFFGGMTNQLSYKNLNLRFLVNYTYKGYAFSSLRRNAESDGLYILSQNDSKNLLDRWQNPGDLALVPKLIYGITQSGSRNSTRYIHDKTHLRLQNISLGYNIKGPNLQKWKIDRINAYIQMDNVGIWTPYNDAKDRNTYRNSFSPYPIEQTYSVGIDVTF